MTKRRIIDILIGLIFLSLSGMYLYDHYLAPPKKAMIVRPGFTKANDILRRKTIIPDNLLNITATSSACTLFLKNSAESSMNDYANEFIDHHVDGIVKTCAGAFPTLLQKRIDDAIVACSNSTREKISKECYAALIKAKTSSVATIIKVDVDPTKLGAPLLLQLVADRFDSGDWTENTKETLLLMDTLLDKEPGYLNGYKAKLALILHPSLDMERERYREHYNAELQDALAQIKSLNPNDPQLIELDLTLRGNVAGLSPEEASEAKKDFLDYLEQESIKHPNDWVYDYHKAMAIYDGYDADDGNYQQAIALVEQALKKAPTNERLKLTIENLKNDERNNKLSKKSPFIISFVFSLDDL